MADRETEKLLRIEVAADETAKDVHQPVYAVAKTFTDPGAEREWDGNLLQCCGQRDRHGYAAFASTLLCLPRTLGLNIRATGRSKWSKSLIVFTLLSFVMGALWINQIGYAVHVCGPDGPKGHPPHHPGPRHPAPGDIAAGIGKPTDQIFLGGATLDPMFSADPASLSKPEENESGFTILLNGEEVDVHEFETTNEQIQMAKNEALEGMAQLGRKVLHKHDHDDDNDDHEHEHEHDDELKHKKQKCKHNKDKKRDKDDDDDDDNNKPVVKAETFEHRREVDPEHPQGHHPDHHPRPEDEPPCLDAKAGLMAYEIIFYVCLGIAMFSGYKLRVRMRELYNIKGSPSKDYCAWFFCLPCAVCQETRTLTKNNVENGVWYGPTQFSQVPTQQVMVVETQPKTIDV